MPTSATVSIGGASARLLFNTVPSGKRGTWVRTDIKAQGWHSTANPYPGITSPEYYALGQVSPSGVFTPSTNLTSGVLWHSFICERYGTAAPRYNYKLVIECVSISGIVATVDA